jgi:hypothetical protein
VSTDIALVLGADVRAALVARTGRRPDFVQDELKGQLIGDGIMETRRLDSRSSARYHA